MAVDDHGQKCAKFAQNRGLCTAHGAPRSLCKHIANGVQCTSEAKSGSVCIKHGAKKRKCSFVEDGKECTNNVILNELCVKHGAPNTMPLCKYSVETACHITIGVHNRFDGACVRCFVHFNPNDPRAKEANKCAKVKEQSVVDFVKGEFPVISWTCDRQIRSSFNDNFALVRPDMRALMRSIDVDTHDLVIEVDEWRHERDGYSCKGENERLAAVWRNLSGGKRPLVVIRINPDNYIDPATGKLVTTCFAYSKSKAKVAVKPSKETEWGARLEKLRQRIHYWTMEGEVPDKELTVEQLFY